MSHATSTSAPPAPTVSRDSSPDLDSYQLELIAALNIPMSLMKRQHTDIRIAYAKYKACHDAQATMHEMIKDGSWELKIPKVHELVELFTSKSSWYNTFQIFGKVEEVPYLTEWLEGGKDAPANSLVWSSHKPRYTFKDLKGLFEGGESEKKKGKRKAAGSVSEGSKKKKKKKAKKASSPSEEEESS